MSVMEQQRYLHEDLERLEQAIADRLGDPLKHIRDRLNVETEIAQLLDQVQYQSSKLLDIYRDQEGTRAREMQDIGVGEAEFYNQLAQLREHHSKYPNQQAENPESHYKPRYGGEDATPYMVDSLFSGEEAFGRFFDLNASFDGFLNLPLAKRITYLQYLEVFDNFAPGAGGIKRSDKLTVQYFQYLTQLSDYLESFMRRTRPLENVEKVLTGWDKEFEELWAKEGLPFWKDAEGSSAPPTEAAAAAAAAAHSGDRLYCDACERSFANESVYNNHLRGKKHVRAAAAKGAGVGVGVVDTSKRSKERAVAEREWRVVKLAGAMSTERGDTRVNVERRQGMTQRERQQELETYLSMTAAAPSGGGGGDGGAGRNGGEDDDDDDDDDERIHNPLKLPLAWDGKPIPFWLYRLHGLGVEFPCQICGNFVYMGRRAFDKHFNEARHIYGLKCLGITNTSLFRDITGIQAAMDLWEKIQKDRRSKKVDENSVVQMEDGEGNVMPEKVYYDLQKQGLL